jgi:type III secretory pathway component EscR
MLFHKIRKQLLDQDKTGHYLKYAIAEIVSVMINIPLAVQVNNWITNRELKKEKLKVLKVPYQEFSENLSRFVSFYRTHLKRRKYNETLMATSFGELSLDSISYLNRAAGDNHTYDSFQCIYNIITNSGKIKLISNDALKLTI